MSEFRFGLGDLSLDLIATVRDRPGRAIDRLAAPQDLRRWLSDAGFAVRSDVTGRHLIQACRLREAMYAVVASARSGSTPPEAALELLNGAVRRRGVPRLDADLMVTFFKGDPVTRALAEIANSCIVLVSQGDPSRIGTCDGCTLWFVDNSRSRRRRWCSMEVCGNRRKAALHRINQQ